jgi:hypothetical protein
MAVWNESEATWAPLGGGLGWQGECKVYSIDCTSDGQVIVAGYFQYAGLFETTAINIARWNGSQYGNILKYR